jgi:hypothetical protein
VAEWDEKAFEFASDVTKQLIALATGVVTVTLAFGKDVLTLTGSSGRAWLVVVWVFFLISIVFGVWTLLALTGTLASKRASEPPSIWRWNVRLPSLLQILTFALAALAALVFVFVALGTPSKGA